jgi:hypothetical protein
MPIALDTNEKYRYVLSTDRSKPADKQPALIFHYPTCREVRQIANKFDEAEAAKTVGEGIDMRCEAIKIILCGWENFTDRDGSPIPYDPAKIDEVLSDTDFTELNARLLREMSMSEVEKKRHAFSMLSTSANSAPNAATAA